MPTPILITGASGFVGRFLATQLRRRFPQVELIAWGMSQNAPVWSQDLRLAWERIDIRDGAAVTDAIRRAQPGHIVHLAALSHVPTALADPEAAWQVNTIGTLHLLQSVARHSPGTAVIYVSSSDIYGRSFRSNEPLDELALLQPENPYSASKAAADLMARQYAFQGLGTICLRPFNQVGPGQRPDFVVASFAKQIAEIEAGWQAPVLKVGNLDAYRDFLDVRDVVNAYALVVERARDIQPGSVFNIAASRPRQIKTVLQDLMAASTARISIEQDPARLRPSDTPFAAGDSRHIRDSLGWQPQLDWQQTITDILDYWRQQTRLSERPQV